MFLSCPVPRLTLPFYGAAKDIPGPLQTDAAASAVNQTRILGGDSEMHTTERPGQCDLGRPDGQALAS
jgi:hypothetical protein